MKTQLELYEQARQGIARMNLAFMEMITSKDNPLTNDDLQKMIARWPERYGRFSQFLGKLSD